MKKTPYENWVEIDTEAVRSNIRMIRQISGCPVMAIIKANAYGHGAVGVAGAARSAGAAFFGVARFTEAMELRQAGFDTPILLFGRLAPEDALTAAAENIRATIFCEEQISEYAGALQGSGLRLLVHAKIDTGMGRLGTPAASAPMLLNRIQQTETLQTEGIYTHFARSDEPGDETTGIQLDRLEGLISQLTAAGMRPKLIHAANSAGALFHSRARRFDMVRAGIAIYGLAPAAQAPLPDGFRPVLSWKAGIISIQTFPEGQGISYGHRYHTRTSHEKIGVIPVGYADGFRRTAGNEVLVRGKRVPVVGTVCMDQCMIQLDTVPEAQTGDEVVLIGRQGDQEISAEEVAARWNTINYEVTSGISHRVDRIYR